MQLLLLLLAVICMGAGSDLYGDATSTRAEASGGFIFDTSGERPLTMPFRLNVGLLGFGSDQLQSGAQLDAVEIESALMVRRSDHAHTNHCQPPVQIPRVKRPTARCTALSLC